MKNDRPIGWRLVVARSCLLMPARKLSTGRGGCGEFYSLLIFCRFLLERFSKRVYVLGTQNMIWPYSTIAPINCDGFSISQSLPMQVKLTVCRQGFSDFALQDNVLEVALGLMWGFLIFWQFSISNLYILSNEPQIPLSFLSLSLKVMSQLKRQFRQIKSDILLITPE